MKKNWSKCLRKWLLHTLLFSASCQLASAYPWVSNIRDMAFPVAELTLSTNFMITDLEFPPEQLVVTATSSNTNFIRNEDIVLAGTGSNRTITVTRRSNCFGTNTIRVLVRNPPGQASSDTFNLMVAYFSSVTSFSPGGKGASAGDSNNDGYLDIVHAKTLFRNNGDSTYSAVFSLPDYQDCLVWGDYDNDGNLDLLVTDDSPMLRVYRANGKGSFTTNVQCGLPRVGYGAAAWGDFDNDGHLDLLLTGSTGAIGNNLTRVYRNNADQTFTDMGAQLPGVELSAVALGDYDNDGRLDFVIMGGYYQYSKNVTRIYHNNGDGTFVDIQAGLPELMGGTVAWGDYDNDGHLDLLVTGSKGTYMGGPGLTRIYRNNGDGTFTDSAAGLPAMYLSSAAWGDFDNDGLLDIVLVGMDDQRSPSTRVFKNNGNGTFTDIQAVLPAIFQCVTEWGDFDNDGRLDLLTSWDGPTQVFRNNTEKTNNPPTAPTNLSATILPHNNVVVSWDPATDVETTNSKGLYYNLRVGTTPGGVELFSPQSDLATGKRRLANYGNAGHTNRWIISNLPRGTYYWSVQAIDTAWAGSPFAAESSFTITKDLDIVSNHPPVADPQIVTLAEDTSATITLTGADPDGDSLTFGVLQGRLMECSGAISPT